MHYAGIDISKDDFWVSISGNTRSFPQNEKGFDSYLSWLQKLGFTEVIHAMEATGVYHLRLAMYLWDRKIAADVVNPQRPYHHGRTRMTRVNNDTSAARNMEDFARKHGCKGTWKPMPEAIARLRFWLKNVDLINEELTQLRNQVHALGHCPGDFSAEAAYLQDRIEARKKELKNVESKALAIVQQSYTREMELFCSIPGVGTKTAMALIAFFCSHYTIDNPRVALVLAGLSLRRHDSGTSIHKKTSITKMGYKHLRSMLYLAALSAKKYNPACKALYDRMLQAGKPKMAAIIAVACKLLRQAQAIWKSGIPYNPQLAKYNSEEILISA